MTKRTAGGGPDRRRVSPLNVADPSGSPFEPRPRLQPAVLVDRRLVVSGIAAQRPDGTVDADAGAQARRCLEIIGAALAEAGATPATWCAPGSTWSTPATSTRWRPPTARCSARCRPANTTVVVAALLNPARKVEIEVEAVLGPPALEPVPEDWSRALAIVAHPDDLEYGVSSAVARWTGQGKDVRYLLATRGEAGIDTMTPAEAGPVREAEERAGAAVVGVHEVDFLDRTDGVVTYDLELRRDLCRAIRRRPARGAPHHLARPVLAGGTLNMADHRNLGLGVLDAARDAGNRWISRSSPRRAWPRGTACASCSWVAPRTPPTRST